MSHHLEYMGSTLKAMYEAWDDLLFNLDSQLSGYSQVRVCVWKGGGVGGKGVGRLKEGGGGESGGGRI